MITAVCVDDSRVELDFIARILEEMGVEVLALEQDGARGMQEIRSRRPTIALLDIILPNMTGLDILAAIKSENLRTVPFMCTSMSMLKKQAMAGGASLFITKPYDEYITAMELRPLLDAI